MIGDWVPTPLSRSTKAATCRTGFPCRSNTAPATRRSTALSAVAATAANVHDGHCLPDLLHGKETKVWGDTAYQGNTAVIAECAPAARDLINRRCRRKGVVDEVERGANRAKSSVRARVEHSIGVIKRVFGFVKVRYRGLEKNANRLFVTAGLANLFLVRRRLLRMAPA